MNFKKNKNISSGTPPLWSAQKSEVRGKLFSTRITLGLSLMLAVASGLLFFMLHPALAAPASPDVGATLGLGSADLKTVVINIIKWALGILTLVAVVYMIYGGYLWLTSAGNEQKIEKAKQTILQAAIGLVIVLLAWAIVFFVVQTTTNVSNPGGGGNPPPCNPLIPWPGPGSCPPPPPPNTFDITAITTCAVRPEYSKKVPLASAVSLTFNANVDVNTVKAAVEDTTADPNLEIRKCTTSACTSFEPIPQSPPPPHTALSTAQVFSGSSPTGAAGSTKAEWVANVNTVTFYHKSFSTDPNNPDYRYFEPDTTYRLIVPAAGSGTKLQDGNSRSLQYCRKSAGPPIQPIEGDDPIAPNCHAEANNTIVWTFTTGTDLSGPPLNVNTTVPTSRYEPPTSTGVPDRNVPRNATVGIDFTNAIDPNSISTANFQIFKFTAPPNPTTGLGGTPAASPLPAADFALMINNTGTGAWMQLTNGKLLESFTWYKVVVKDVQNLCGTSQLPSPYEWVFETNDVQPGVRQVYPTNGFQNACPSTEVFIQYNTSMWKAGSTNCDIGAPGTYVTSGAMSPDPGRALRVVDQYDPVNPNTSCTTYAFTPTSVGLQPGKTYSLGVTSDLSIDIQGTKLWYGDTPPLPAPPPASQGPWSFKVDTPANCVQPPYITSIDPGQGPAGQCISVLGNHFEKQVGTGPIEVGQNNNTTQLKTLGQGNALTWTNGVIVSSVVAGALTQNASYNYTATVNYAAPIGPLTSNASPFFLNSDSSTLGPCLVSINPNSGPVGTAVTATGLRFKTAGTNSKLQYNRPPITNWWNYNDPNWTDTSISSAVGLSSGTGQGLVRVIDKDGKQSNELKFTVTIPITPGPGGPQVEETTACDVVIPTIPSPNPKKDETQACINAAPSARFVGAMDVSTLTTANITLQKCDPTCSPVTTGIAVSSTSFQLNPSSLLAGNTNYRVTIGTNVKNAAGVAFASPYIWNFTTKSGTTACPFTNVVIDQTDQTFNTGSSPFSVTLPSRVVDSACNTVDGRGLSYAWSNSDDKVCALLTAPPLGFVTNLCSGPVDINHTGTAEITTATEGKTSNAVKIAYGPTACTKDADCRTNGLGETCGGVAPPTCVSGQCTPVVNDIDPNSGKIGTWVTFKGCWFGTFKTGTSKVLFTNNQEGLPPNPTLCGSAASTWANERIIREVPDINTPANNAITGPTKVVRQDGAAADGPVYTVDTVLHPGLCKINPTSGKPGASITLSGQNFGSAQNVGQDKVTMTNIALTTAADATSYPTWQDDKIETFVPTWVPPANGFAGNGKSNVVVNKKSILSGSLPFTVLDPSLPPPTCPAPLRCIFPNDSTCTTPGQACGYNNCCTAKPKLITTSWQPAQGAQNVCRNTQAQVTFDQPLDRSTANNSTVTYLDGSTPINGQVGVQNTATTGTIIYQPGLLSTTTNQQLSLVAPIRGSTGALADLTGSPLKFKTGPDICALNQVAVTTGGQNSHTFFAANQRFPYQAEAWPAGSTTPLAQIPGVYTWDWRWLIGPPVPPLAAVTTDPIPSVDSISQQTVTSKNTAGSTYAQVTATVTENQAHPTELPVVSGQAGVNIDLCENPWTIAGQPGPGFYDPTYHYQMSYCRGNGTTSLLPNFEYSAIEAGANPGPLQSLFFKEGQTTRDVIGMLIFANPNFLSPADWYNQRFPLDTGGSSAIVGGYPALRAGTTTYIGVTNFTGSALEGIMVVIDFNSNSADQSTKNIYNQILNTITFNTNMDGTAASQVVHDTQRRQDIASVALLAEGYRKKNGSYPNLAAGSYLVGISTSAWPSWQGTLGNTLGRALPQDPKNDLVPACVAPYESSTCWSEPNKAFRCPANSHIYLYQSDGAGYSLYGRMEYIGPGSFATAPSYNPCSGSSNCSCFNYQITTNAGGLQPPVLR